jgi:hypothetical protein
MTKTAMTKVKIKVFWLNLDMVLQNKSAWRAMFIPSNDGVDFSFLA